MEEIEKEINIHQRNINKLSNVIYKEENTDILLNLSKDLNKENIILENLLNIKKIFKK